MSLLLFHLDILENWENVTISGQKNRRRARHVVPAQGGWMHNCKWMGEIKKRRRREFGSIEERREMRKVDGVRTQYGLPYGAWSAVRLSNTVLIASTLTVAVRHRVPNAGPRRGCCCGRQRWIDRSIKRFLAANESLRPYSDEWQCSWRTSARDNGSPEGRFETFPFSFENSGSRDSQTLDSKRKWEDYAYPLSVKEFSEDSSSDSSTNLWQRNWNIVHLLI